MVSSSVFITSLMATTAAALPHLARDGTPTATASSTASSSAVSSTGSGGVQIVNNMNTTVYLWTTSSSSGDMQVLNSGGDTYNEGWATNSDSSGISIKMSTTESEDSVLQFEYTKDGETLFWDLSCIDLNSDSEFITAGFSVTPGDSSCASASCAAGDTDCADAYQKSDDVDTYSCSSSVEYTLTLG